jgi:ADP-dependent NAD(P)H-hydrate dehydratase / NAD(P)H-hydrate epimerase
MRCIPARHPLPYALYQAAQVREFDRIAGEELGIPGRTLMERAGAAAFRLLRGRWPEARRIAVVCGVGNNGGDGYVVARLALEAGLEVRAWQVGEGGRLRADALACAEAFAALGGAVEPWGGLPADCDLILDAVFGTGLEREVTGDWRGVLEAINRHPAPVLAVDLPSGLHADSGRVLGAAVRAAATISFIALKPGLFTGEGPDCCGEVHFDGLEVPARLYSRQIPAARRIDWGRLAAGVPPRRRTAHKGECGHVLVIGGDLGYAGAPRLAAEAAARTGAGLVSLATRPEYAPLVAIARPEIMARGIAQEAELIPLTQRATVIALGPGLGQSDWSRRLWGAALSAGKPLVVDADGLNLLAETPLRRDDWILTPHAGEAARLLGCTTAEIQVDRFAALARLRERYGGTIVLKGAGTLVAGGEVGRGGTKPPALCSDGNPGMASGGMGDSLTGVIAGLLAQGWPAQEAAELGVCLHAAAADRAALAGERGLLAGDLTAELRGLLNQVPVREAAPADEIEKTGACG